MDFKTQDFRTQRDIDGLSKARLLLLAGALACGLAACASGSNPAKEALTATGFATKTGEAAGFVREKRPGQVEYMKITRDPEKRPTEARSAEDVKALEADLEKVRAETVQRGAAAKAVGEGATASSAKPATR